VVEVHEVTLRLERTLQAPGAARHAVDQLPLDDYLEAHFNFRLLVTELVSNCVRHADLAAGDLIIVEVTVRPRLVRAVVGDRGNGFSRPEFGNEPPSGTSGRGLFLVDALADRWGTGKAESGESTVWFELDLASA
jgi:anti-sigma regulatory factor (Ser/Thr protein kinase)